MNTVEIILALRERMKNAGYRVQLGETIDPEQDKLPCVTIQIAAGGIQVVSEKPLVKKTLSVLVDYVFKTTTRDPLIEVLEATDKFNQDLVQVDRCKGVDQLGGAAFTLHLQKTNPLLYPERSDLGRVQSILVISYTER